MEWWQALVLALVQGLTEFLPISSSAHLLLPSMLLGWPDQGLAFDVAVHFGTLIAVVIYFRRDLWALTLGGWEAVSSRTMNDSSREIGFLALATVPAVIVGFALNDVMDSLRTVPVIATTTIVFALLLAYADGRVSATPVENVASWQIALVIGCAQAIAPIPGTSRSGITITAGLLLGLSRHAAARFSFLLSIPIILGAALLKTLDLVSIDTAVDLPLVLLGTAVAALSAYACIAMFLRLIEAVGMLPFVIYRLLLGAVLCGLLWA
ncbi:undecaprenyl-diphosphate phosphatase [Congregibacter sp.]|uniref:undecaprenyl-diphosphate phosphatase n=1 Tax=Congregibacter sp. TaxID=2744308 RepID=UPI00386E134A